MGAVPDLSRAIGFRSQALNTVTTTVIDGTTVMVGCTVDSFDPTQVEIRQFTEPMALIDGIDVGGTWLGARHLVMAGTVYDKTRGECFDRLAAIEAIMLSESGTFGYYALTYYTVSGSSSTPTQKTINVRPGGLRYVIYSDKHGGPDNGPCAVAWSVVFYAKDPAIS